MEFEKVVEEINRFWNKRDAAWNSYNPVFRGGEECELERIQGLFPKTFPLELRNYVKEVAPDKDFYFRTVGNDICIYNYKKLSNSIDGYSFNPVTGKKIDDWSSYWFLLGDEGGDPLIVDLSQAEDDTKKCPVLQAMHGEGKWNFREISSSISQFLLCAAYQHHALVGFDIDEPIIDKGNDLYHTY